jgi:hypothetical protein
VHGQQTQFLLPIAIIAVRNKQKRGPTARNPPPSLKLKHLGFVSGEDNTVIQKIRASGSLQRLVNSPRDTDNTILLAMQAKSGAK